MRVLSLFDGISCGMVALERAGIHVENYIATKLTNMQFKRRKKIIPKLSAAEMFLTAIFPLIGMLIC